MKVLDKIKFILDKFQEIVSTITLGVMTVIVVWQVVARYIFNNPSAITGTLSQYLFVWMIMFGSAYVFGSKEHLTIDILKDKFRPKTNMIVEIITNICLFIFVLAVCVIGGWLYTSKQAVQIDPALLISKSVMYFSVPFTGVITMYYAVYNSVLAVKNYHEGKRTFGDELSGTA